MLRTCQRPHGCFSQLRATFKLKDLHPYKSSLSAFTLCTTIEIGGTVLVAVRCEFKQHGYLFFSEWRPVGNRPFPVAV